MKNNGSSVPKGAMKIGFLSRGIWSDFFELTNEGKSFSHEREVSRAKKASRDNILRVTAYYKATWVA